MSKFKRDRVYLIIADSEVTESIVNASASRSKLDMPAQDVGGVTYRIVEVPLPCPEFMMAHKWYDLGEIESVWKTFRPA